jgi:hypothetical protein
VSPVLDGSIRALAEVEQFEFNTGGITGANSVTSASVEGTSFFDILVELPPGVSYTTDRGYFIRPLATVPEPGSLVLLVSAPGLIGLKGLGRWPRGFRISRHRRPARKRNDPDTDQPSRHPVCAPGECSSFPRRPTLERSAAKIA